MSKPRKLVVGLGNPGDKYAGSRHNAGWRILDAYAAKRSARFRKATQYQADIAEDGDIWLVKPQTFMNASGAAVAPAAQYYKVSPEDVLVVSDDLDLPYGSIRYRGEGGAGGQRGLEDVIEKLGTSGIPRLRIGIGRPAEGWSATDYVLAPFTEEEDKGIQGVIDEAIEKIEDWVNE